jgi:hypothetical protein
MKAIRESLS